MCADVHGGMHGPWNKNEQCLLTIVMRGMDHDIKITMFADYYDGIDGP